MKRARIGDAELEYEVTGEGTPMLFVHGANLADGMAALSRHPALTGNVSAITYHRRGMAGSTGGSGPSSVERQARDALELLDALSIERAHVVGYSYGGTIALELAAEAPDRLLSLSLLEPIIVAVPSAGAFMASMAPINERYASGDVAGAITGTFEALGGPTWRQLVESAAGAGSVEQAIRDAAIFFESEGPSLATWTPDGSRLGSVSCPVLSVRGSLSGPFFAEGRALLHEWFPQCVDVDLDGATHFLHIQQPDQAARAIAELAAAPTVVN